MSDETLRLMNAHRHELSAVSRLLDQAMQVFCKLSAIQYDAPWSGVCQRRKRQLTGTLKQTKSPNYASFR